MAIPVKTIGGAYGYAIGGLALGVLGAQRFYVRRHVSGAAQTAIFLAGLFILVSQIASRYLALYGAVLGALSAGDGAFGAVDLTEHARPLDNLIAAYFLMGAAGLWWLLDLFLIPSMVRQFNAQFSDR